MSNIPYRNRFSRCGLILSAIILLAVSFIPDKSFADSPIPPRIKSLIQKRQDVKITLNLDNGGYCWANNRACTLTRMLGESTKNIFIDKVFNKDEAPDSGEYCSYFDTAEIYCNNNPSECIDCDGDDIPECDVEECSVEYYFEVVDKCVPPGEVIYIITALNADEQSGPRDILVEDTGDECLDSDAGVDSGTDADADTDSDSDADLDTDDDSDDASKDEGAGCGVVQGAASSSELILALLMITAGLAAFRFRHS